MSLADKCFSLALFLATLRRQKHINILFMSYINFFLATIVICRFSRYGIILFVLVFDNYNYSTPSLVAQFLVSINTQNICGFYWITYTRLVSVQLTPVALVWHETGYTFWSLKDVLTSRLPAISKLAVTWRALPVWRGSTQTDGKDGVSSYRVCVGGVKSFLMRMFLS